MQHAHYDLDKIERETRNMFDQWQTDGYSEEFFKKAVTVQVELTRNVLVGIMEGREPGVLFDAAAYTISQLMLNLINHFDGPSRAHVMGELTHEIDRQIYNALSSEDAAVAHSMNFGPVQSGTA